MEKEEQERKTEELEREKIDDQKQESYYWG
jgi:hypothetical protein